MAKVSELKDRARALEQEGELAKAQAIYGHILKHLEGTPALISELPLYVKVGDLAVKQGDASTAVSNYRQAAVHYARAGSSRSIRALVRKIRTADPGQQAIAIDLGRELLLHGHAVAAAEVIGEYAREQSRQDVASLLAGVVDEGSETPARALVESGLSLLTTPPSPAAPPPAAEPTASPPPQSTDHGIASSMVDALGRPRESGGEGRDVLGLSDEAEDKAPAPGVADGLMFLSIEDESAAKNAADAEEERAEAQKAAEAAAKAAAAAEEAAAEEAAAEEAAAEAAAAERAAEAAAAAERRAAEGLAALEEALTRSKPKSEPAPAPEPQPASVAERETTPGRQRTEWEREAEPEGPESEPALAGASRSEREPSPDEESPSAGPPAPRPGRAKPTSDHVLVGRHRPELEPNRKPIYIAVAVVLVIVGAAIVWLPKILAGGGATVPPVLATLPVPTGTGTGTDTASPPADTAASRDTTQFGPVGFNAVSETARAAPPPDTARRPGAGVVPAVPDSLIAVLPDTRGLAVTPVDTTPVPVVTPPPAPTLATIVVPPGYATAPEIVVVPGLEVLSVAEIGVGDHVGYWVVQRTPEGVELSIRAVPGGFGADTVGTRGLRVTMEADTAVGTLRFWSYQVAARAVLPANTLSTLLTQLERRRPVN